MPKDREHQVGAFKNENRHQSLPQNYAGISHVTTDEEKVVKELGKLLAAAQRRAVVIIAITISVSVALLFKISQRPPVYNGRFQLLVEPVTTSESRLQAIVTETEGNKFATYNGRDFGLDYATQIRVLKSPTVMEPIMQQIESRYPNVNSNEIRVVRPFEGSEGMRILEVSYAAYNPQQVKFVLEQVADGYLRYSRESRLTNLRNAIEFIDGQIPPLRERVNTIQQQVQQLRREYNFMDPDFQGRKIAEQLNFIENKRLENQAQIAELKSQYITMKQIYDQENYISILSQNAAAYSLIIRQLQETQNQIVASVVELEEEHPSLMTLREQERDLRLQARSESQVILQRVADQIKSIEERDLRFAQAQNVLEDEFTLLPDVYRQYQILQGELQVATSTLSQYLSKLDGLRIDAAQQELPWQLIAAPRQPQPSEGVTRKTKILMVIMSFLLGIGSAFLLEIINNVFHSPDDIEDDTRLPLLAVIPRSKYLKKLRQQAVKPRKKTLLSPSSTNFSQASLNGVATIDRELVHYDKMSPSLEAFRSLYTNIRLLSPENHIHSFVIGAAKPGEGKSTVAVQLAKTAATIGQRVLLVDADLRRPKIHEKLGLPNFHGLSEAISTDISLNEVIQRCPDNDNLFILTSGLIPQDPIKLLCSKKMYSLMEQFQDFFDLVIYDTPPMEGLADVSIIAAHTDGLALVVKLHKTDRSLVMKALERLKISGTPVLGLIANGAKR